MNSDAMSLLIEDLLGRGVDLRYRSTDKELDTRRANHRREERSMEQPTAEQALRRLEPLVGEWNFEAKWPDGEPWPGGGRVTFEWYASGAHLLQHGTAELPEAPDNVSIIGCDAANGTYYQLYSDERGVCRVYEMSIGNQEWKLWREGEPFSQRFTATFSDDGSTINGRWEIAEDGTNYTTDFDLILRKVDGHARRAT
jgi:hypothetical protein